MSNYFNWAERLGRHYGAFPTPTHKGDVIDFPDVMVSEAEANPETMRQYEAAEQRKALTLVEEADAVWRYTAVNS